jgi:hypothetical protein
VYSLLVLLSCGLGGCGAGADEASLAIESAGDALAIGDGTYTLKAVHSGKCADVFGASTADAAKVQQYTCHGRANQQWMFRHLGSDVFEIKSVSSNKCLDITGASQQNGAAAQQWSCNGSAAQRFKVVSVGNGAYQLQPQTAASKCLDVSGVSRDDGAPLQQWGCWVGDNQKWLLSPIAGATGGSGGQVLYTQIGTDPTWEQLLARNAIPIGVNSTGGVLGSKIDVNNPLVEAGADANSAIEPAIKIHTVANSTIPRRDFYKWTRWYQEDGHTQVFRLFKGEHNVRNTRPDAARIEAFSDVTWGRGAWHQWVGTYTIVKPHACAIFQAKNSITDWGVMLNMTDDGDVVLNHRRHQSDVTIASAMTGKSFRIRVRDNGHDYEVYLNERLVGAGYYDRPEGTTAFRWGMYDGTMRHDAMLFVTGATVDP